MSFCPFSIKTLCVVILLTIFPSSVFSGEAGHVAVVCPKAFHRSLEPWIRHRIAQGYFVHVIVEPFEEGKTTPNRIKRRLELLSEQTPLSAVLLVGAAARIDEDRKIPSPQIPCRLIGYFGEEKYLASDDWYADLDGDGLPDFAVGRFPAETVEDLDAMIRKTIRYETEIEAGSWMRQMQIVAGIGGFSPLVDGVIENSARYALTEMIPGAWDVSLLHADWRSPFCPAASDFETTLFETLDRAPLFWVYLGHGRQQGLDLLRTPAGEFEMLRVASLFRLRCRESLPIAFLLCCYGASLDAGCRSVAEEMFVQADGPVAVVGASRTTMPYGMSVFGIEFFQEFLRCRDANVDDTKNNDTDRLTLGALLFRTKHRMLFPMENEPKESEARRIRQRPIRQNFESAARLFDPFPKHLSVQLEEHAALFHLLGDPLLKLFRSKPIRLECARKVRSGSVLRLKGFSSDCTEKSETGVTVELVSSPGRISLVSPNRTEYRDDPETRRFTNEEYRRANDFVILRRDVTLQDGAFEIELPIPEHLQGEHIVRVFGADRNLCWLGSHSITITPAPFSRAAQTPVSQK